MGPIGENYTSLCANTCGGAGRLVTIESDQDEYYVNGTKLGIGVWCTVRPLPCNLKTGYVVASINSYVCRPKYPNMFGGPTATNILACNNDVYGATGSQLWDYKFNVAVEPSTVIMTNENELLPDGEYRFRCKFGRDTNRNAYVANPLNRFHPMRNWCNKTVPSAHPDVQLKITSNPNTWICDCGDYQVTRVKNADPQNPQSTCSACILEYEGNLTEERIKGLNIIYPRPCFNVNSPYVQVLSDCPCNPQAFVSITPFCDRMKFNLAVLSNQTEVEKAMPFCGIATLDVSSDNNVRNDRYHKIMW
jgi:hypothetical protein